MRFLPLSLLAIAAPGLASAHTGHLGEVAGHDHWVLGAGIAVIVGAAVIAWLKGDKEEEPADEETRPEDQSA